MATDPSAQRSYRAEFDVSESLPGDDTESSNPYDFHVISFQDLGGL